MIQPQDLIPALNVDAQIPLTDIHLDLVRVMESLEPYGEGNPSPVFCSRHLIVKTAPQILGKETLKFWVSDGASVYSAVGFGMAKQKDMVRPGKKIDLAYEIIIDDWNSPARPQLKIKDIKQV